MKSSKSIHNNPALKVVKYDNEHLRTRYIDDGYDDEEINLLEYWNILKRRSLAIFGLTFTMALVGILLAFTITPQYKSTIKILVEPDTPRVVSLDPMQGINNITYFYQTQYDIISSRSVVETVVEKLNLEKHPVFIQVIGGLGKAESDNSFWRKLITDSDAPLVNADDKKQLIRESVIGYILQNLDVKGQKNSQIIHITFESPSPVLSANIANAIADAYIEKGLKARLALNKNASVWLTSRLSELRQKLDTSENMLRIYQKKEGMVNTKSFTSMKSGKLGGITEALIKAQAARAEAEIRYQQVKDIKNSGKNLESLSIVLQNQFIQTLKAEQAKLARHVSDLSVRYGYKHPKMISANSDLRTANLRLQREVDKVIDGITRNYEVAVANVKQLNALSRKTEQESRSSQNKEFKLAKLERDVIINRQLYDVFMTRFKETSMTDDNGVTNVSIVDLARPAIKPSKPKKKLIVIAAIFAGLFLGILLVFLLEFLDNTFRTPEDIESKLGLPVLGVLPRLSNDETKRALPERYAFNDNDSPAFIEALNNIRTGITFANIDSPASIIMVTSSSENEGKTTLSSNLAYTFSLVGKTLLIDGDLRKQQYSKKILQNVNKPGLTELAAGKAKLEQCVAKDSMVKNLYYISEGLSTPKPLEFLSSKRFASMLEDLKAIFKIIIIDSAPLLPVSDSLVIANLADEVILVVKADSTTHNMAKESIKRLATAHVKPLGVVLQQADLDKMGTYGALDYGYGYGKETS